MKRLILGLYLIFTTSAIALPNCDVYELQRSIGGEWEHNSVYLPLIEFKHIDVDPELVGTYKELANSKFRELFDFYGQDENGNWSRGYIPESVGKTEGFLSLATDYPQLFELSPQGWKFLGWSKLDHESLGAVTKRLMEARGKFTKNLKVRKVSDKWSRYQNEFDLLIPNELAEEWKGSSFSLFEFPMSRGITRGSQIKEYVRNLWLRLEFFKPNDPLMEEALELAVGHVHWLPNIPSLDPAIRADVYEGEIGYWADFNDSAGIDTLFMLGRADPMSGFLNLTADRTKRVVDYIKKRMNRITFSILTAEMYERISYSAGGIIIKDRHLDLDPKIDANVPPTYKRLPMGMRGIYGQETYPGDGPIPLVGLESRNGHTFEDNMSVLPKKKSGTAIVDIPELLTYQSNGPRGMVGSEDRLKVLAAKNGMRPGIISDYSKILRTMPNLQWTHDQARALIFLPLNDWLNHPLARRNLAEMTEGQKEASTGQFEQALERYVARLNKANEDLYRTQITLDAYEATIIVEAARFLSESDLPRIMRWRR